MLRQSQLGNAFLVLSFLFAGFASPACSVAQTEKVPDLIVTGGSRFVTSTGQFEPNEGIVVRDGRIVALQATANQRKAAKQIVKLDKDESILPGFIDLHAHYNVKLFKKRREEFTVMPIVYLANGATVTYSAGEYDPDGMQNLRQEIESGDKIGPRLINSGPYFGRARPGWGRERSAEEIRADVKRWAPRVGCFKAKSIRPEELKALIDAAHEAGLTVTGHLGSGFRNTVNPRDAIEMGIDRVEHFLGGSALPNDKSAYASLKDVTPEMPEVLEIVRLYVETGTWFNATISAYGYFGERGEVFQPWFDETSFFTPFALEKLKGKKRVKYEAFEKIFHVKQKIVKLFYDAGGKITLGTDHFSDGTYLPGFGVHRELDVLVKSGIPPADAIRIGTINGATALNLHHDHGSIEKGKFADLYVIKGDPLKNIRHTRNGQWVIRAGKVYDCKKLFESVAGKLGPQTDQELKDW